MADVGGVLKKLFPFISVAASMGGGPIGTMAANALGTALGVQNPKPGDITNMLTAAGATPAQLQAAQEAERQFALQMQQLGFQNAEQLEQIAANDRASARDREIKTGDSRTPQILAGLVVLGWIGVTTYLIGHTIGQDMRDIIMRLLGTLDAALVLVLSYYFGSSAGSAKKDETLQNLSKQ